VVARSEFLNDVGIEIERRAQRTNPAAEDTAQKQAHAESHEAERENRYADTHSAHNHGGDERIDPQKKRNWDVLGNPSLHWIVRTINECRPK
jgi:hypothetical protein